MPNDDYNGDKYIYKQYCFLNNSKFNCSRRTSSVVNYCFVNEYSFYNNAKFDCSRWSSSVVDNSNYDNIDVCFHYDA